jgi:division protein CdvB (Snf7/Vps24/ESCRT-III family)
MKFYVSLLILFLFVSCSKNQPPDTAADEQKKAKNKEIALKNEVTELTRLAQKLEQQGRAMEMFRERAGEANNDRECLIALEDGQKQLKDFEARVKVLPENYNAKLSPISVELNQCISCEKKAMEDCKKARAFINQAIKEIY